MPGTSRTQRDSPGALLSRCLLAALAAEAGTEAAARELGEVLDEARRQSDRVDAGAARAQLPV
jgi:hypothetical protein